ncbi:hypothetical protein [Coleofasciculus sp. F4-SAH-05]|uniref:hypothetical protein n=1 Tax=Coleofasciculus sp. F4-SAH-05 TaxID=3069525 RepID=UPI003300213B
MSDIEQDASQWMLNEMLGIKTIPATEDYEGFIKAVLICAKGDGILAPEERSWLAGCVAAYRNPRYELAKTYEPNEDLQEVLSQTPVLVAFRA